MTIDLRTTHVMKSLSFLLLLFCTLVPAGALQMQLPGPPPADPNPWNGTWKLDSTRSSPGTADQAAEAYRFTLGPSGPAAVTLKWEIPSLGEVVSGRTDGQPMAIHRSTPSPGQTLSVRTEGISVMVYNVYRDGKLTGGEA